MKRLEALSIVFTATYRSDDREIISGRMITHFIETAFECKNSSTKKTATTLVAVFLRWYFLQPGVFFKIKFHSYDHELLILLCSSESCKNVIVRTRRPFSLRQASPKLS